MASSPSPTGLAALLLCVVCSAAAAARFSLTDNHLLACGAAAPAVLPDGRRFVPDSGCASARLSSHAATLPAAAPTSPPPPSPLHAAARVFTRRASYDLAVRSRGHHVLRLHFYPLDPALSASRFHVGAGGLLLLRNFTASSPVVKEFILPPVDSDFLVLTFVPESGSTAFVNAIELFSAPEELVGDIGTLVTSDGAHQIDGLSSQVFETLYRITVAGRKVTPFNDTLWRTWVNDRAFLVAKSPDNMVWSSTARIAYPKDSRLMSREVAPDNVYNSLMSVKSGGNATWGFPVPVGGRYLVRMHFCDIVSKALYQLFFNIYVNGHLAVKDFDLSSATGFLAYPYYIDFVVDMEEEGMLKLGIGGSKMSRSDVVSGILNALEIMRMNKTSGGMDGDFPVALDIEYAASKRIWEFSRSLLCGFIFAGLFVILVMLVLRLRVELKNTGTSWSWRPIDSGDGKLAKAYQLVPSKTDY